jgi:hypothetical protein
MTDTIFAPPWTRLVGIFRTLFCTINTAVLTDDRQLGKYTRNGDLIVRMSDSDKQYIYGKCLANETLNSVY